MPASDGPFADLDEAATGYAAQLSAARRPDDPDELPHFDVLLLGLGPDGHARRCFPGTPAPMTSPGR